MRGIRDIYNYAEVILKIPGLKNRLMNALFPIHQSTSSTVSTLIKVIGGSFVGHSKLAITLKILTIIILFL